MRIDKWLWAARFFKTRTLAAGAVDGGRVHVNGQRVKPAKDIEPGDELAITIGELRWTISIRALAARRGPAAEARALYEETPASIAARQAQVEQRRLAASPLHELGGRPTKRHRREIDKLRQRARGN